MIRNSRRAGFGALVAAVIGATAAQTQDYSTYLEKTGKGAYDLYRNTVLCNAVLQWAIDADPQGERRPHLEKGIAYTANFALFLLESGNVADPGRMILTADDLPARLQDARAVWQTVIRNLQEEGKKMEAAEAEVTRCLGLYGHDWQ